MRQIRRADADGSMSGYDTSMLKLTVLNTGFLKRDARGNVLDADSTVTLIRVGIEAERMGKARGEREQDDKTERCGATVKGKEKLVLVDTAAPATKDTLCARLKELKIGPEDIDTVVNTHAHWDHCGNNGLFRNAEIIIHENENMESQSGERPGRVRHVSEEMELFEGLRIIETPGHTYGSISVVATDGKNRNVICGDAIPTEDNFRKWLPPNVRVDETLAIRSMERIRSEGDIIVPGHGNMFEIGHGYRHLLESRKEALSLGRD